MAQMRHANPLDLMQIAVTRRRQRVLRLNPPYTLVQPDTMMYDLLRSQVPVKPQINFIYVYRDYGAVLGFVQARSRWRRRDEWAITTLGGVDRAPEQMWEKLLEEVCMAAGEEGVTRLFVKLPKDEELADLFRALGFTQYTSGYIWGNLFFGPTSTSGNEPPGRGLRRQANSDAWDLMQVYSSVAPPVVQRAEALNSRQWQISKMPRPWFLSQGLLEKSYVWPDECDGKHGLGGYIRLLTGARGHWITMLFRPDAANRAMLPIAVEYVLWKAARYGPKPVYCEVREYQAEAQGVLEEKGFHLLSEQSMLVKYLAEPIKVRQPALAPFLVRNPGELAASK